VSNAAAHLIGAATYRGRAGYCPAPAGLIDEYRLVIHPVVPGAGERLFRAPLTIEPVSTTVFSAGAVAHVFAAHP
jgi:dihydrofolate reductase